MRCPKCGSQDIHTRYCDGSEIAGSTPTFATFGINRCKRSHEDEALHRTCRKCQYRWTTGTGPKSLGYAVADPSTP